MKTDTLLSPISTLKAVFPWQQLMTPADKLTKTGQYTVLQFVAGKQFCGAGCKKAKSFEDNSNL